MGDFLTKRPYESLSDSGLGDLLPNMLSYELNIIRRYPEKGLPPSGIPFAVDVEVRTEREYGVCFNATVVARGATTSGVGTRLAMTRITTSTFRGCRGTGKLVFPPSFRPTKDNLVVLEVYYGEPSSGQLTPSRAAAVTTPIHFGFSEKDGINAGIYEKPSPGILQPIENPFAGVADTFNKILWVAGLGLGAYLITPLFPVLKVGGQKIASRLKK